MESILFFPCSRFDPSLSHCRQGAALARLYSLPPYDLVICTDASVPFSFGKGGSDVLANCSLSGTEAILSFLAGPVCSSFSAKTCAILLALRWSRQHKSAIFLLFDFRAVLATLPFLPSFLLLSGGSGRKCLFSHVLSGLNGSLDTRFSRGTTRLMSWPDGLLVALQSLVVYLLSVVSTLVFFRTGGVLSYLDHLIHRFPLFSLRNLCSFVTLAVPSLVFAATDTAFCYALISLGLAESRILLAASADIRPRTLLISFCTVQLRTLGRSLFDDSLSLYDLWSRDWGVVRLLGLHGPPPCSQFLRSGRVTTIKPK